MIPAVFVVFRSLGWFGWSGLLFSALSFGFECLFFSCNFSVCVIIFSAERPERSREWLLKEKLFVNGFSFCVLLFLVYFVCFDGVSFGFCVSCGASACARHVCVCILV